MNFFSKTFGRSSEAYGKRLDDLIAQRSALVDEIGHTIKAHQDTLEALSVEISSLREVQQNAVR